MKCRHGLALHEVIVLIGIATIFIAGAVPMLRTARCDDRLAVSKDNLATLAMAHAAYAADWNDRQFTVVRDDLGAFGGSCVLYDSDGPHPPLLFGAGCDDVDRGFFFGDEFDYGDCQTGFGYVKPFHFWPGEFQGIGSFLIPNAAGFQPYGNGRFFDPTFYAPRDEVVLDIVDPLLDVKCGYAADSLDPKYIQSSSYSLSPAAMFDPGVLASPVEQNPLGGFGFASPDAYADGYRSPAVSQALYPALKTRMLEHRWLQREPPVPCNLDIEGGTFDGCEPYLFAHGYDSRPATLFFDGHVDTLAVREAQEGDTRNLQYEGYGLWHRGTPMGSGGYFGHEAFDFRADNVSFHILTTDGIRGRDMLDFESSPR